MLKPIYIVSKAWLYVGCLILPIQSFSFTKKKESCVQKDRKQNNINDTVSKIGFGP